MRSVELLKMLRALCERVLADHGQNEPKMLKLSLSVTHVFDMNAIILLKSSFFCCVIHDFYLCYSFVIIITMCSIQRQKLKLFFLENFMDLISYAWMAECPANAFLKILKRKLHFFMVAE